MNAAREAGSEEKMRIDDVQKLKQQISKAGVVSFDVFDTLLFRKVDTQETIFDIIGKCFGIYGFRKLRIDCQNEASRRAYALHQYPHADFNEIYEVLSEHTEIPVDWQAVKEFEIQLEKDALVCKSRRTSPSGQSCISATVKMPMLISRRNSVSVPSTISGSIRWKT